MMSVATYQNSISNFVDAASQWLGGSAANEGKGQVNETSALSVPPPSLLAAIRGLRDAVVGRPQAKSACIAGGAVPLLLALLAIPPTSPASEPSKASSDLRAGAAATLCSVAHGPRGQLLIAINAFSGARGPLAPLFDALRSGHTDGRPIDNILRTVRSLVAPLSGTSDGTDDHVANTPSAMDTEWEEETNEQTLIAEARRSVLSEASFLATFLGPLAASGKSRTPATIVASIIAAICTDREARDTLSVVVPPLIEMLLAANAAETGMRDAVATETRGQTYAAVLSALAALTRDNTAVGKMLSGQDGSSRHGDLPARVIFRLFRDRNSEIRILSAICLVNLHRTDTLPATLTPHISITVLPGLVKLLGEALVDAEPELHARACATICRLVSDSDELQRRAMELEVVSKLAILLQAASTMPEEASKETGPTSSLLGVNKGRSPGGTSPISPTSPASPSSPINNAISNRANRALLLENVLLALATVSSLKEEPRKQIIDANLLPRIVSLLAHPDPRIQASACQCTMSLSRSVKNLRTSLVDAGVAEPLFKLLETGDARAQVSASATICNIVLDFSPMKKTVLESGVIPLLVRLITSPDLNLRLNAIWAIKNLCYRAPSELKLSVMEELTWDRLISLLRDPELSIREQAINLLRNLACGKEQDIEQAFAGLGEGMFEVLEANLGVGINAAGTEDADALMDTDDSPVVATDEIALQTLYVIANLATGGLAHKNAIMERTDLLKAVLRYMDGPRHPIRVAALWVAHNLSWPDDIGAPERVAELRDLGYEDKLRAMQVEQDLEVKDKIKQALHHFQTVANELGARPMPVAPVMGSMRTGGGQREVTFGSLSGGSL